MESIKILRATVCGGKRVEKGAVLTIDKDVKIADALRLISMGKATAVTAKKKSD